MLNNNNIFLGKTKSRLTWSYSNKLRTNSLPLHILKRPHRIVLRLVFDVRPGADYLKLVQAVTELIHYYRNLVGALFESGKSIIIDFHYLEIDIYCSFFLLFSTRFLSVQYEHVDIFGMNSLLDSLQPTNMQPTVLFKQRTRIRSD